MVDIKRFVHQNPKFLVKGYVPVSEIIAKIKFSYGGTEILTEIIPNLPMHRFNAVHLPSNELQQLNEQEVQIKAICIPITEASRHYIEKDYVPVHRSAKESDFIYLAYEEQLGYLYSNSNQLFLESILARGIPEAEIQQETEEYTCYLFYLKCYLEYKLSESKYIF